MRQNTLNGLTPAYKRMFTWMLIALFAFFFIYEIRSILLPFVIGVGLAYLFDPLADRMENEKMGRGLAAILLIALCFAALVLALILVMPPLVAQTSDLLNTLPQYLAELSERYGDELRRWINYLNPDQAQAVKSAAGETSGIILKAVSEVAVGAFVSGMAILNVLGMLLITPLVAFYLLRDWDTITQRIDRLLPRASAPIIRQQLHRMDQTLAAFLRGQLNVCLILAVYFGIGYTLIGLNFGLVIGIATGILFVLPYIGPFAMASTAAIVATLQDGFGWTLALVGVIYATGQFLESYFLTPRLVGEKVGLHPLWIIFGMFAGGALFGFVGVLIAVPATAVISVLIRFAIERYLQSPLYFGS